MAVSTCAILVGLLGDLVHGTVFHLPLRTQGSWPPQKQLTDVVTPQGQKPLVGASRFAEEESTRAFGGLPLIQPLVYDLAYTVEVGVGTPPQLFNLMIDIATADTYLDSKEDQEDDWECTSHNFYESEASSTFETNHTLTNTQFMFKAFNASGEVSGDVFRLGSMEVADHRFINSVNNTAQGMWLDSLCPVDGILGFSPPEFASDINSSSAFATLARQGHLDKNLFALRLRDPTELSLGGINPTQFTGKIVRVPMRDEDKGRVATGWQTKTDYLMFGSEPALHYVLGGIPTSFAMSMFPMYLPGWMVSDILASLEFEEVDFYAVFNRLQPKRLSPRLDLQL